MTKNTPPLHETQLSSSLSFNEYEAFVRNSRFNDDSDGWQDTHARLMDEERFEMMTQHGVGDMLLMPFESGFGNYRDAPDDLQPQLQELRYNMADEMGDCLWFAIDAADRSGVESSAACTAALLAKNISVSPPQTFEEVEQLSVEHAASVTVPSKAKLTFSSLEIADTPLSRNPGYLLARTARRLSRSLDQGARDIPPFSASELEPVQPIDVCVGDFLLTLAYVARTRLDVPFDRVATFNMQKLAHRVQFGKANDIHFSV